jgi:hypothetical protein
VAFEKGVLQAPAITEISLDRAIGADESVDCGSRDRRVLILD